MQERRREGRGRSGEKQACLSVKVFAALNAGRRVGLQRVAATTTARATTTTTKNEKKDELETTIQCGVERLIRGGGGRGWERRGVGTGKWAK